MIEHIYISNFTLRYLYIGNVIYTSDKFPGGSAVKNLPANAGDLGLSPGQRRFPGEGNGNPLREFMNRGGWQATVHGVTKEWM